MHERNIQVSERHKDDASPVKCGSLTLTCPCHTSGSADQKPNQHVVDEGNKLVCGSTAQAKHIQSVSEDTSRSLNERQSLHACFVAIKLGRTRILLQN